MPDRGRRQRPRSRPRSICNRSALSVRSTVGTARTADKLERARPLGLDVGIVADGAKFAAAVLEQTGGRGVDVVVELVGGAYVPQDLACLAMQGRVVVVGMMAGNQVDLDLGVLMRKRAELRGTHQTRCLLRRVCVRRDASSAQPREECASSRHRDC